MIIAVSGSQGVGKSTLLNKLSCLDYAVDRFSVSRSVQKKLNYSALSEALSSYEIMKDFQEEVLTTKLGHDALLKSKCTGDTMFVERSFYDILAYAETWSKRFPSSKPQIENWLSGFKTACCLNQEIYDAVIFIDTNDKVIFEHDKNRGDKASQKEHNDRLKELCSLGKTPYIIIEESDIEVRVREAINFVDSLRNK
jgi:nicotinamide riboside kinase